ncbi:uncharacterized protein BO72DRAFT_502300 [Aspergillus fijiensis CBS 313.89]|uniref:Uncharacterized protein n=1 Tax=Aspergillus fijiensis CBS 313.89 TaxID=1448319 RepID=A0A8G1RC61_9EURO|nr:uncharacterized protein BO72DRAFT_502300 [Aspergillus fijiensis CBS 313.89]RAK71062.1 hypothetical protein BO72DRAFT_502300 [Aspergillus fijiensis CBS 313.89]
MQIDLDLGRFFEPSRNYWEELEGMRARCRALLVNHQEPTTYWTLGDPNPPPPPARQSGRIATPADWANWPLVRGTWDPNVHGWPPAGVRLSDAWLYLAIKYMGRKARINSYWADFNRDGLIRPMRVPVGDAMMIAGHGLVTYPVYQGWYVLCGGAARVHTTWLVGKIGRLSQYPYNSFLYGLVFPVKDSVHIHVEQLHSHRTVPDAGRDGRTQYIEQWVSCRNDPVIRYFRSPPDAQQHEISYRLECLDHLSPWNYCSGWVGSDPLKLREGCWPDVS